MLFSVPNPAYELTLDQVMVLEESTEPSAETEYLTERLWQFTELESFLSGDDPSTDGYDLARRPAR